jgi:hypothetical protein
MKTSPVAVLFVVFIGLVSTRASAGPIVYGATFDTVSAHYFTTVDGFDPFPIATSTMSLESSTGVPTFTADFLNDKQLTVTYSAPAGHKFVFNPPLDANSVSFSMWLGNVGGIVTGPGQGEHVPGISIDFAGAEGSVPAESSFDFVFGDGSCFPCGTDDFAAFYRGSITGPFAFQSVTAMFTVAADYDVAFNAIDPVASLSAGALWFSFGDPEPGWTDPGVWASIERVASPVPEPTSLLLLGIGVAATAAKVKHRRKQAK